MRGLTRQQRWLGTLCLTPLFIRSPVAGAALNTFGPCILMSRIRMKWDIVQFLLVNDRNFRFYEKQPILGLRGRSFIQSADAALFIEEMIGQSWEDLF